MSLQHGNTADGEAHTPNRSVASHARLWWIVAAVLLLAAARIAFITFVPPGFYLDEAAGAAHAIAMLRHGHDAWGTPHPLYSPALGGGFTTAFYLYPLTAWMAAFGTSEVAIRAFSLAGTFGAIFFLSRAIKLWLGRRDAWLAAAVALALPWNWIQGSVAWDPALVPLAVTSSFWAFSHIVLRAPDRRRGALLALFPVLLLALAYLYPPTRVTAALLFVCAYAVFWHRRCISIRGMMATLVGCLLLALPLVQFMVRPEALVRARGLSVFHDASIAEGFTAFGINMLRLLAPGTLFLTGDPNLRHGTGFQGLLGFAALAPILGLVVAAVMVFMRHRPKQHTRPPGVSFLLVVACVGWLASLTGAALTNEGQPHSLRSCAAWPFASIVLVVGWRWILQAPVPHYVSNIAMAWFVLGIVSYGVHAAWYYPPQAMEAFETTARRLILSGQPPSHYPALALRYYETR